MLVQVKRLIAGVTMLAAGGAGHIYPITTNPLVSNSISVGKFFVDVSASFWHVKNVLFSMQVATGDGVAMAHRAHTIISNME